MNTYHWTDCYLKKYADRFRVRKLEDGAWVVMARKGHVWVHSRSAEGVRLAFYLRECKSGKGVASLKQKLSNFERDTPVFTWNMMLDFDGSVTFPETMLERIASALGVYNKKTLSPAHKQKVVAALERFRLAQQAKKEVAV